MGKGGGGSSTTVQKADPWKGVQPYLKTGYQALADLYGTPTYNAKGSLTGFEMGAGPQYYPGQTVASTNPLETQGQNQMLGAAGAMGGVNQQSLQGLYGLLGGMNTGNTGANYALGAMSRLGGLGTGAAGAGQNMYSGAAGDMGRWADYQNSLGGGLLADAMGDINQIGGQSTTQGNAAYMNAMRGMNTMLGSGDVWTQRGLGGGWEALQRAANQSSAGYGQLNSGLGMLNPFSTAAGGGLGMMRGAGDSMSSYLGGAPGEGREGAVSGMNQLLAAGDPMNNPYLASAMNAAIRPVQQQFTEQVMPGIKQGAMEAGQMGSSRQGVAEGIASRGYLDTVSDLTAQMGSQAYGQGLDALKAGAGIGQGLLGAGLESSSQQGALGQAMAQLGLGAAGQRIGAGQDLMNLGLGAGSQLLGMGQGMYGQTAGIRGQQLGAGIDLSQLGLTAEGMGAQYSNQMQDRAAQMQQALLGGGIDLAGLGMGALGTAGGLGQSMYDTGTTAAGRGLALSPQMLQNLMVPGQMTQQIGQQRTADQQAQIDAAMHKWNYEQQLPYSQISDYLSMLAGAPGGVTSSTMSGGGGGGNSLMGGLGGAMSGYGMGSSLAGALGMAAGPWAWGGAALGGALGLFG